MTSAKTLSSIDALALNIALIDALAVVDADTPADAWC
jgi:hypothetical protein